MVASRQNLQFSLRVVLAATAVVCIFASAVGAEPSVLSGLALQTLAIGLFASLFCGTLNSHPQVRAFSIGGLVPSFLAFVVSLISLAIGIRGLAEGRYFFGVMWLMVLTMGCANVARIACTQGSCDSTEQGP